MTVARATRVELSLLPRCLWVAEGRLIVQGTDRTTPDGRDLNGAYLLRPSAVATLSVALSLPRRALRDWHRRCPDLFDVVVGYHLRGELNGERSPYVAPPLCPYRVRLLLPVETPPGVNGFATVSLASPRTR